MFSGRLLVATSLRRGNFCGEAMFVWDFGAGAIL